MKTKTKRTSTVAHKLSKGPRKGSPRKSVENRDLNVDQQTTNADREEEWNDKKTTDVTLPSDRSVEDEEDREAKRKITDANPAEDIQN